MNKTRIRIGLVKTPRVYRQGKQQTEHQVAPEILQFKEQKYYVGTNTGLIQLRVC
jgi:hypothetical protein